MSRKLAWGVAGLMILVGGLLASRATPVHRPVVVRIAATPTNVLARCRGLGEAGLSDEACQAAWRASRDQFFGRRPGQVSAPGPGR